MESPAPSHHLRPRKAGGPVSATAAQAGWRFLDFAVHELAAGQSTAVEHVGRELAIVPIAGTIVVEVGGARLELSRDSVFSQGPQVLYCAPQDRVTVETVAGATFTTGGAPAEGRYPTRLFSTEEMRVELRGGGSALRQVNHLLAAPLPAERLILYEIVAPRGTWCGWPPHRHDGDGDSPYLEEVYYFRFDRPEGYAIHHNYSPESGLDELFTPGDGDVVLVTEGYHTTVAAPGTNMYFLNYLAGEPTGADRARPPCFDARHTWITSAWDAGSLELPTLPTKPG
ncbi:MAG TPA: 5-deoxy-glucuronate isomerase [Acidimicrobiales bacterium]|nr:5-deoxy-glucuronate isomerase [Acidimicrobiales bacterium]